MGLWDVVVNTVSPNVGMGVENIILLFLVLGSIIIMAKDFKLGILIMFLTSGVTFLCVYGANMYYSAGLNFAPFLALLFISLVILVFTLYTSSKIVQSGGSVI